MVPFHTGLDMDSSSSVKKHPIEDLIEVMAALRNPDGGCPWDLEQDFKSIAPYTIEEAYEVADAIQRENMTDLREELGDLLLQPIYHAQMASEEGLFNIEDVIRDITAKMISRHPHVFGDTDAQTPSDVNEIWDARKKAEQAEKSDEHSVLDGVAHGLPALLRAQKFQKKAAKLGFEWPNAEDAVDKLEEEKAEMRAALRYGDQENQKEELGDILFVLANFARMIDINAETSLRDGNYKFEHRFKGIESKLKANNKDFSACSLEELEHLWEQQKQAL